MAGEFTFKCAVREIEMKETNHWLMSWVENGILCFAHFNKEEAIRPHVICLCGDEHCHTILSQKLPELAEGAL
jgi:hypothetical protein